MLSSECCALRGADPSSRVFLENASVCVSVCVSVSVIMCNNNSVSEIRCNSNSKYKMNMQL